MRELPPGFGKPTNRFKILFPDLYEKAEANGMSNDDTIEDQIAGVARDHGLAGMMGLMEEISRICLRESLRQPPDSDGYNAWKYAGDVLDLAVRRMNVHEKK